MIEYIEFLRKKHRATLDRLIVAGKTYRSRDVAREQGYLNALRDIEDAFNRPQKNAELKEAVGKWAEMLED
ncbi:hypothetical protein LCGC14_0922640 [marine sediment metagenome]|uniref:Uncharacterized protein n=1 Tax=marine sediment metagenome TaxID=412755 RepID=A0A0F9NV54_9ZZZZ